MYPKNQDDLFEKYKQEKNYQIERDINNIGSSPSIFIENPAYNKIA